MPRQDKVWQGESFSKRFLEGIRSVIPLASEQIELMALLIKKTQPGLRNFIDLGCGDGILGRAILDAYPESFGVFVDFSDAMLAATKEKLKKSGHNTQIVFGDMADKKWLDGVKDYAPFEGIVSGLAIHHQPDERKKEIYKEIFDLLAPGGIFINIEHVQSETQFGQDIFWDMFYSAVQGYHREKGEERTRAQLEEEFAQPRKANILAPLEDQLIWLHEIGFIEVDCHMKYLEQALFAGIKP